MNSRVLVVDDSAAFLTAAAAVCAHTPGVVLVGTATNADDAVALARYAKPHVVLVDLRLADGGVAVAERLRALLPDATVLVCATDGDHVLKEHLSVATLSALCA